MTTEDIIFSSTRQWNPGDEFILRGVRNVFDAIGVSYNPIIYNRNPDIRPLHQHLQIFRASQYPDNFDENHDSAFLEANIRFGFFDNSVKPNTNGAFVSWVVLAGTPEWCNMRVNDLYSLIAKHNIPLMALGVGGGYWPWKRSYQTVLEQAKAIVVRDRRTFDAATNAGLNASYLPCPALLSATRDQERPVTEVRRRVGLIYQATKKQSVLWSGLSDSAYANTMRLYRRLIERLGTAYEFEFICHYIDEVPLARSEFPGHEVKYSFESMDYFKLYARYDLVVGPRVHGIGVAASIGVPGVALVHDHRGSACEGFLAETTTELNDTEAIFRSVETALAGAVDKSAAILAHKRATMRAYKEIVSEALRNHSVSYDADDLIVPWNSYALADVELVGFGELARAVGEKAGPSRTASLIAELKAQNGVKERRIQELETQNALKDVEKKEFEVRISNYEARLKDLEREKGDLTEITLAMIQDNGRLRVEQNAIYSSISWKVAKPLRSLEKRLKRLFNH